MNKLYLLTQLANEGCHTYDSAIVSAPDEETARYIHPSPYYEFRNGVLVFPYFNGDITEYPQGNTNDAWCDPKYVKIKEIGTTDLKTGLILASYNAG